MSKVRNNHNWLEIAIKQNRRSIIKTKFKINNIFKKSIKKGFSIHRNKSNEERQSKNQQSTILGSANQDIKIRKRRSPKLSIEIGFRIRNQSFERHRSCNDWLHQSRNCHFIFQYYNCNQRSFQYWSMFLFSICLFLIHIFGVKEVFRFDLRISLIFNDLIEIIRNIK